jgi:hypothetical protein
VNTILRVEHDDIVVATKKAPAGERVPLRWVQDALDRLESGEEVEVTVDSLRYRSAFIGAFLAAVPGTVVSNSRPRRVSLPKRSSE